ncbi:hypothetical protein [Luteolibacter luteus]|uniref:Uncharacterized protein n=1 Tax=Luteolibacter luteus TaxID=2728835 RepID=A0A858RBM6_9BACT|nr:hypothetical protein [Luteolibacter luteus]QJE94406.1 hypothetical protein HHL09_00925 [Luteolibacter luteus]
MKPGLILVSLALLSCDGAKDSTPAPADPAQRAAKAGTPTTRALESKARTRDAVEADTGAIAVRKMEKALKTSDHDAALQAFQELLDVGQTMADDAARHPQTPDKHSRIQKSRVDEARIALRNHGVDQSAIDQAWLRYSKELSRVSAIRELEVLDSGRTR